MVRERATTLQLQQPTVQPRFKSSPRLSLKSSFLKHISTQSCQHKHHHQTEAALIPEKSMPMMMMIISTIIKLKPCITLKKITFVTSSTDVIITIIDRFQLSGIHVQRAALRDPGFPQKEGGTQMGTILNSNGHNTGQQTDAQWLQYLCNVCYSNLFQKVLLSKHVSLKGHAAPTKGFTLEIETVKECVSCTQLQKNISAHRCSTNAHECLSCTQLCTSVLNKTTLCH